MYDALVLQTRFKPLLDSIDLVVGTNGVTLDFAAVQTSLQTRLTQDAANGLIDLIEFNRYTRSMLMPAGWNGDPLLETNLRTLPVTPALQAVYDEMHVKFQTAAGAPSIYGGDANDVLVLGGGNDQKDGGQGDDTIFAGDGIDRINGGLGNDRIYGGAGDDQSRRIRFTAYSRNGPEKRRSRERSCHRMREPTHASHLPAMRSASLSKREI